VGTCGPRAHLTWPTWEFSFLYFCWIRALKQRNVVALPVYVKKNMRNWFLVVFFITRYDFEFLLSALDIAQLMRPVIVNRFPSQVWRNLIIHNYVLDLRRNNDAKAQMLHTSKQLSAGEDLMNIFWSLRFRDFFSAIRHKQIHNLPEDSKRIECEEEGAPLTSFKAFKLSFSSKSWTWKLLISLTNCQHDLERIQ